jgi:acetyltransferase-like isoleucine patch superfamily enzyme
MKQNKLTLLRYKILVLRTSFRIYRYKKLGFKIGHNTSIGKVGCTWYGSVSVGNRCTIEDGIDFKVDHPFRDDNYIKIGDATFIGRNTEFHTSTKIIVGNDCMIASQCIFAGVGHEYRKDLPINNQPTTVGDIVIEDDVWLGIGTKVLQGVVIGKGSIIGAGSLVNKSIPGNEVWAGCPARFIKNR